jgi:hypothetical protein
MAKKVEMVVIKDGAALDVAIDTCIDGILNKQDEVHMLAVSGMYHYWLHGDSTRLTRLTSGITKCHGSNKRKLIGYLTEACGLNWDATNLRFKKAKDSTFTKVSGVVEFPEYRLMNERWYEFKDGNEIEAWMIARVLKQAKASIEKNSEDAADQAITPQAWAAWNELQQTVYDVGMREIGLKEVA